LQNGCVSSEAVVIGRRHWGAVVAAAAAYAWVAGHFTPFTWPAAVATFVPGALGLGLSTRLPRRTTSRRGLDRRGWLAWIVVIGAILALETVAFFSGSSTQGHPTISNIVNHGLHWELTRGFAFFGWLAFGSWLLKR
jgi:hypothetical protein